MAVRDQVFQRFGPKLLEVLFLSMLSELNDIRVTQNKQPLLKDDILNSCLSDVDEIEDYDFMNFK